MIAMNSIAIAAHDVSTSLGHRSERKRVLRDISVDLAAGKWTSIVGPNGAGKSTFLQCLIGVQPCDGHVSLRGQRLRDMASRERAKHLSWLGQNESSANDLRVWDVVMLGRLPHQAWLASPSQQDHAAVERALRLMQAWDWRERSLGQLSGGERQRVLLARALAVQAQVLLMDEPLVNLDPPHQADWLALMRDLVAEGKTVVSVLHELSYALQADALLILDQGRVFHHGSCSDASTHRALEAVFDHRISVHALQGRWVVLPHLKVKNHENRSPTY
jgi:iron complex transport system ATP-binding protein